MAINLKGSDASLIKELEMRNLEVPMSGEGNLIRGAAIEALRAVEKADNEAKKLERKCKVIFHRSNNPNANPNYVFVSLNERSFQAPYEEEVEIEEKYLRGCIDLAQVIDYAFVPGTDGSTDIKERRINIYPYTFLGYVDEDK